MGPRRTSLSVLLRSVRRKPPPQPGLKTVGPGDIREQNRQRRRLVWSCVVAFLAAWFLAFFRFFLPRTLFEPATTFKIGYPADYGLGVDTKYQQKYRIWVDKTPDDLFVIYARCTHLGCTPDWKPSENKFKCPCHGSGYDSEASQLRRAGAASDGSRARGLAAGRSDCRGRVRSSTSGRRARRTSSRRGRRRILADDKVCTRSGFVNPRARGAEMPDRNEAITGNGKNDRRQPGRARERRTRAMCF